MADLATVANAAGGSGGLAGAVSSLFSGSSSGSQRTTPGDVDPLREVLKGIMADGDVESMEKIFQAIFKSGFEKQAPSLLNAANVAGVRPQDSTTSALLSNDLLARLSAEAQKALHGQQVAAGNLATNLADQTKTSWQSNRTLSPFESFLGMFGIK